MSVSCRNMIALQTIRLHLKIYFSVLFFFCRSNCSDDNHCAPAANRGVNGEPSAGSNVDPPQQQPPPQARPPPLRSSLYRSTLPREFPTSYDVANASAWYPEERSNRPMPNSAASPADPQPQFPYRPYYTRNQSNAAANNNNNNANNNSLPLQGTTASSPSHSPSNVSVPPNPSSLIPPSNEAVDTSTNGISAGSNVEDVPTNRPLFLNPHTGNWSHASRSQMSSRCPFMLQDRNRRYNIGGHHYNVVHQFPYALQNNNYHPVRPAYAPHENLWYRQQNNQEMHRRHLMTSGNDSTTDGFAAASGNTVPPNRGAAAPASNAVYCLSCDHQHPTGISHQPNHHRRIRTYVCSDPPPLRNAFIGR